MTMHYYQVAPKHAEIGQIIRCIVCAENEEQASQLAESYFQKGGIQKETGLYEDSQFPLKVTKLDEELNEPHVIMAVQRKR